MDLYGLYWSVSIPSLRGAQLQARPLRSFKLGAIFWFILIFAIISDNIGMLRAALTISYSAWPYQGSLECQPRERRWSLLWSWAQTSNEDRFLLVPPALCWQHHSSYSTRGPGCFCFSSSVRIPPAPTKAPAGPLLSSESASWGSLFARDRFALNWRNRQKLSPILSISLTVCSLTVSSLQLLPCNILQHPATTSTSLAAADAVLQHPDQNRTEQRPQPGKWLTISDSKD